MTTEAIHPKTIDADPFQNNVFAWVIKCFGADVALDHQERCARFIEESLELAQSLGFTREAVLTLVDYTFSRPIGEPAAELGGVMTTLAALSSAAGLRMGGAADTELARINTPEMIERIRTKHKTKPKNSPLPGSADGAPPVDLRRSVELLRKERDSADRFAGAAAREIATLRDDALKHGQWLSTAKRQWGVSDNTSFDDVFAHALRLKAVNENGLGPVDGDVLPKVGEPVMIYLNHPGAWSPATVSGYYVWPGIDKATNFRVFVRVLQEGGAENARALQDCRRPNMTRFVEGGRD